MPDTAASNGNHLLPRIDERLKGLDKKVDRFIQHQDAQDKRIYDNEKAIAKQGVRLDNLTKVFAVIQAGFVTVIAWFKLGP